MELLWSDWHVDELITPETTMGLNEWNPKIAERSIETLVDNSLNLIELESKLVKLPDIVVWLGGDFISGPIHEELEITNTMEPDEAIVWLKPRLSEPFAGCSIKASLRTCWSFVRSATMLAGQRRFSSSVSGR